MVAFIAGGIVGLLQIAAVLFLFVIRYHFRAFSIPGDARAIRLARLSAQGTMVFIGAAVLALVWFLISEAPRLEALLKSVMFRP